MENLTRRSKKRRRGRRRRRRRRRKKEIKKRKRKGKEKKKAHQKTGTNGRENDPQVYPTTKYKHTHWQEQLNPAEDGQVLRQLACPKTTPTSHLAGPSLQAVTGSQVQHRRLPSVPPQPCCHQSRPQLHLKLS